MRATTYYYGKSVNRQRIAQSVLPERLHDIDLNQTSDHLKRIVKATLMTKFRLYH